MAEIRHKTLEGQQIQRPQKWWKKHLPGCQHQEKLEIVSVSETGPYKTQSSKDERGVRQRSMENYKEQ